ncbi:MAG TPA: hypothetical protein VFA45_11960, partial [Actinomycetes bacterium]|nr:hypothetical protein [Actinomycetes bacterium]
MTDEMRQLTELRQDIPPITIHARLAIRTRLVAAASEEPAEAPSAARPRRRRRPVWRVAAAGALS